jgi:hypothetical protein
MILRQTLVKAVNSPFEWDGGAKRIFDWSIDRSYDDGKSRVGSWGANHYFEVKTGKTEKATLANAKRHLRATTTVPIEKFEYIEEE